jgi:alpha-tubulin suppressor-like RCC1 family protein
MWLGTEADAGHTCAVLTSVRIRCWGHGSRGKLGYGNEENVGDDELPASVGDVDVPGSFAQFAFGSWHTCALTDIGTVRCWGLGSGGRLGYGNNETIGDDETPASVGDVEIGGTVVQLAAGVYHTCALLTTGAVRCWGYGLAAALGYGNVETIGDDETPVSAGDVNVGGTVVQLSAGFNHTCALLSDATVRCWGTGLAGELGLGDNLRIVGDDESPASVPPVDVGGPVRALASGSNHVCALLTNGALRCWGSGDDGKLGYGNTEMIGDDEAPAAAGDVPIR